MAKANNATTSLKKRLQRFLLTDDAAGSYRWAIRSSAMEIPGSPFEGLDEFRLALRGRLRIALDYATRALRATQAADAHESIRLLHEEVEKARRIAERWKESLP